jgi:hypothetical protein
MSKAYVPPHKRKGVTVELKPSEFPSLTDNVSVKAGAGGPSYASKAIETTKEEKTQPTPIHRTVEKSFNPVKEVIREEVFTKTVPDESEWITKESKSYKKTKPDSDWDDFEDY